MSTPKRSGSDSTLLPAGSLTHGGKEIDRLREKLAGKLKQEGTPAGLVLPTVRAPGGLSLRRRKPVKVPRPLRGGWNPGPLSRSCGDCDMCCVALPVRSPDLEKDVGVPCEHLCEAGCGIYADPNKPAICTDYACNWLRGDGSHDQRPDRMGALPTMAADGRQLAFYLAPGLTPDTLSRAAQKYARHWHKVTGEAVVYLWGDGYKMATGHWPDGERITEETTFDFEYWKEGK